MDDKSYEAYKRRLDEDLEGAIALLRAAYQVQLQALEIVRKSGLHVDLPFAVPKPPPKSAAPDKEGTNGKPQDRRRRTGGKRTSKRYGSLQKDLGRAINGLGNEFSTDEVMEAMPPAAKRGSVRAALKRLVSSDDLIRISEGRFAKPGTPEAESGRIAGMTK